MLNLLNIEMQGKYQLKVSGVWISWENALKTVWPNA